MSASGDDAEVLVTKSHDGEVALEPSPGAENGGVHDLPDRYVHLAHRGALHHIQRRRSRDVEHRECREVDQSGRLAHLQVFGVDDGRPPARFPLGGARHHGVAELLHQTGVALVPPRTFPADRLVEHGTERLLSLVVGREAHIAVA